VGDDGERRADEAARTVVGKAWPAPVGNARAQGRPLETLHEPPGSRGERAVVQRKPAEAQGESDVGREAVIIYPVVLFYKEPKASKFVSDQHRNLLGGEDVTILEQLEGGWTRVRVLEKDKTFLEGYVRSSFVKTWDQLGTRFEPQLEKEQDTYYEEIADELDEFWLWDSNVGAALSLLDKLSNTGDQVAFTNVVMRLRNVGYLERLFRNLEQSHLRTHTSTIARLAIFVPPSLLAETSKIAASSIADEALSTIVGPPGSGVVRSVSALAEGGLWSLKIQEALGDTEQLQLSIDDAVRDMLELEYVKIEYLAAYRSAEEAASEIEWILDLGDAIQEMLFSDKPTHPLVTGSVLDVLFAAWEWLKRAPTENLITITDAAHPTGVPLSELRTALPSSEPTKEAEQPSALPTVPTTSAGTVPTAPEPEQPQPDLKPGLRHTLTEIIVAEAERLHEFLDARLFPLITSRPALLVILKTKLEARRSDMAAKLTPGLELYDWTVQSDLEKSGSLDKATWMDLARIWLYELGPAELGSREDEQQQGASSSAGKTAGKHPLQFGETAWTTRQLRAHPNMVSLQKYADQRAQGEQGTGKETFYAHIGFGTDVYFSSLKSRDVTMNFLGSFDVEVTIDYDRRLITFRAYNEASLESAFRFRRDPRNPGKKIGVIGSHERGKGTVPLGGTLALEWIWTEPLPVKSAPPKSVAPTQPPGPKKTPRTTVLEISTPFKG
jgi:hypothetical protein